MDSVLIMSEKITRKQEKRTSDNQIERDWTLNWETVPSPSDLKISDDVRTIILYPKHSGETDGILNFFYKLSISRGRRPRQIHKRVSEFDGESHGSAVVIKDKDGNVVVTLSETEDEDCLALRVRGNGHEDLIDEFRDTIEDPFNESNPTEYTDCIQITHGKKTIDFDETFACTIWTGLAGEEYVEREELPVSFFLFTRKADGKLVGKTCLEFLHGCFEQAFPTIKMFEIIKSERGKRLGPTLLKFIETYLSDRGFYNLALCDAYDSRTFWQKMGFEMNQQEEEGMKSLTGDE